MILIVDHVDMESVQLHSLNANVVPSKALNELRLGLLFVFLSDGRSVLQSRKPLQAPPILVIANLCSDNGHQYNSGIDLCLEMW